MEPHASIPEQNKISPNNQPSKNLLYFLIAIFILFIIGVIWIITSSGSKTKTVTTSSNANIKPAVVSVTSNGFVPETVSIKVNQSVIWTNNSSSIHLVATDPYPTDNGVKGFKSGNLNLNDSYTFVFSKAGTYTYHDDLNPYKFKGIIVVKN
jgi:plastocyanin